MSQRHWEYLFPVSPFLWSFLLSASFSSCIHTFFSFPTLPFMCKKWAEKMSSWCWSKELVLPFFQFLSLPEPPLLAHISQSAVKRDAFSQQGNTKSLGIFSPVHAFCHCQQRMHRLQILSMPGRWSEVCDLCPAVEVVVLGRPKELLKQMPSARGLCLSKLSALSGDCATWTFHERL